MKEYKNIYVNGCSFTAGHELLDENTWPVLLSNLLGVPMNSLAANGQSLDNIKLNSISHLSKFDASSTLVIIGLTWKERYGFLIDGMTVNITPADIGRKKGEFNSKIGSWRRAKSPYNHLDKLSRIQIDELYKKEEYQLPLYHYSKYYESLIKLDKNLEKDQMINHLVNIISLQSFLKTEGFDYKFILWEEMQYNKDLEGLINKIDYSNIIEIFIPNDEIDYTSHPNTEQCKLIANKIHKLL
jgi:hypothetical protein